MLARSVDQLPVADSGRLRYEPKLDGYRAIASILAGRVHLRSRRGAHLGDAFPEVVTALAAHLPAGTVVDGEIVRWADGRLDFSALQRRYAQRRRARELARVEPAHYAIFDVLETVRDGDLRRAPLWRRREVLERLLRGLPSGVPLALTPQTADVELARRWYEDMAAVGVEGLVIKPADGPYLSGSRAWMKYKTRTTTEAIVGGVTGSLARPHALLLGRYASDTGELRYVGRTTPLSDQQAKAVAPLITPAAGHPWPERLSLAWRTEPTKYLRVEPLVVVEVHADVATDEGRRWRHAVRMLRVRDISPGEVPRDLDTES